MSEIKKKRVLTWNIWTLMNSNEKAKPEQVYSGKMYKDAVNSKSSQVPNLRKHKRHLGGGVLHVLPCGVGM